MSTTTSVNAEQDYLDDLKDAYSFKYGDDVMGGMLDPETDIFDLENEPTAEEWERERLIEERARDWLKERNEALRIKRNEPVEPIEPIDYTLDDQVPF